MSFTDPLSGLLIKCSNYAPDSNFMLSDDTGYQLENYLTRTCKCSENFTGEFCNIFVDNYYNNMSSEDLAVSADHNSTTTKAGNSPVNFTSTEPAKNVNSETSNEKYTFSIGESEEAKNAFAITLLACAVVFVISLVLKRSSHEFFDFYGHFIY